MVKLFRDLYRHVVSNCSDDQNKLKIISIKFFLNYKSKRLTGFLVRLGLLLARPSVLGLFAGRLAGVLIVSALCN